LRRDELDIRDGNCPLEVLYSFKTAMFSVG
jgi:hypothetical protein